MARVDADRNLLFGLLALQNNFIDRDALLDAFDRWVHDRSMPLGPDPPATAAPCDPTDHDAAGGPGRGASPEAPRRRPPEEPGRP